MSAGKDIHPINWVIQTGEGTISRNAVFSMPPPLTNFEMQIDQNELKCNAGNFIQEMIYVS